MRLFLLPIFGLSRLAMSAPPATAVWRQDPDTPVATAPGAADVRAHSTPRSGRGHGASCGCRVWLLHRHEQPRPARSRAGRELATGERGIARAAWARDSDPCHRAGTTGQAVDDGAAGQAVSQLTPRVYFAGERADVLYSGLHRDFRGCGKSTRACRRWRRFRARCPSLWRSAQS